MAMTKINLTQLEYFMEVAECESMSRAADRLYVSQSTVSKSIAALEEELGVDLFTRNRNKIFLNEYGRVLQQHCENIFLEISRIRPAIRKLQYSGNIIRIASTRQSNIRFFTSVIKNALFFRDTVFDFIIAGEYELEQLLIANDVDLVMCEKQLRANNIYSLYLSCDRQELSVPKNSPLSRKKVIRPEDIADAVFLRLKDNDDYATNMLDIIKKKYSLHFHCIYQMDMSVFLSMIQNSNYLCLSSKWSQKYMDLGSNRVMIPFESNLNFTTPMYFAYNKDSDNAVLSNILSYFKDNYNEIFF